MDKKLGQKNTKEEQNIRTEVLNMCWSYLQMNFHKMTETNKVKIITTLCGKNIPQELEGKLDLNVQMINYGENNPAD